MSGDWPLMLAIDDEPPIRRLLRTSLAAHGCRVIEAETAADGILGVRAVQPDAVILDLGLPDQNGIGVILALRDFPRYRSSCCRAAATSRVRSRRSISAPTITLPSRSGWANSSPTSAPLSATACERAFRTLQDRLPKELDLAGITGVKPVPSRGLSAGAQRPFRRRREKPGSAFVAGDPAILADILSIQEERRVGNDNTLRYGRHRLQVPPGPLRPHYVRAKVRVHHYPDGTFAVFHGPRCLARYAADGSLHEQTQGQRQPLPRPRPWIRLAPSTGATTSEPVNRCAT